MSAKRDREIAETVALLSDRGYASPEFMQAHSPLSVIVACEAWAKRVGIIARGSHAVGIATGRAYPGLFERLMATTNREED